MGVVGRIGGVGGGLFVCALSVYNMVNGKVFGAANLCVFACTK